MIKARVRKVKITRLALGVFAVLAANANAQTCSEVIGDSNGLSLTYPSNVGNGTFICGWEDTTDEGANAISLTVKGYNDGIIIGGYSLTGGSANNSVILKGDNNGSVTGGSTGAGDASSNTVILEESNNDNGFVVAGYSDDGSANSNTVSIIRDNKGRIIGGSSFRGNSFDNTINVNGDNSGNITGGSSYLDSMYNTVHIRGNNSKSVEGGYSLEGSANNNTVIIEGDTDGEVLGGNGQLGANHNLVILEGNAIGIIIAGRTSLGTANNNVIKLLANREIGSKETEIYGGYTYNSSFIDDLFVGNTLDFSANSLTAKTIANFENYNFTLDPKMVNKDIASIMVENITLGNSDESIASKINVVAIKSGEQLKSEDRFLLIKSDNMTGIGEGGTFNNIAQQGVSIVYDVKTTVDVEKGEAVAVILGDGRVNPQLKALSEGNLADLMLVTRGADIVAYSTFDAIKTQNEGGLNTFVKMEGAHNRYSSGSNIKSNDFHFMAGGSLRHNDFATAVFIEAGWGNYDTRNTFADFGKVDGDGKNRYVGVGILGRYDLTNGMYVDGSFRIGSSHNKFHTSDIKNDTGEEARYSFNRTYVSAHAGLGYIYNINSANSIDFSAKYLWTHLGSKNLTIAGDSLKFKSLDSNRVQLRTTLNHQASDSIKLKAGVGYEYEFSAKAKATALEIYSVNAPSVKGGTGIAMLGISVNPESNKRLDVDLNINGYVGKRQGVGANIKITYNL